MSRWIRWSSILVVVGVAATAGWVSYDHALSVVRLAGATGPVTYCYPVFVDGLVYMSSMVLLAAAQQQMKAPPLAWCSLGTGIALTLGANIYAMAGHGVLGGIVGALPAVALVLSTEMLMWIIRHSAEEEHPEHARHAAPGDSKARLNGHAERAQMAFADELAAGTVPGIRRIKSALNVGNDKARLVRDYLTELGTGT